MPDRSSKRTVRLAGFDLRLGNRSSPEDPSDLLSAYLPPVVHEGSKSWRFSMRPEPHQPEAADDLFRNRLSEQIDLRHPLVRLAGLAGLRGSARQALVGEAAHVRIPALIGEGPGDHVVPDPRVAQAFSCLSRALRGSVRRHTGDRRGQDDGLRRHRTECAGEDGADDVAAAADDRAFRRQACLLRLSDIGALPCLAGHGGGCWPRWKARSLAIARSTSIAPLDRFAVGTFADRSQSHHQDDLWL